MGSAHHVSNLKHKLFPRSRHIARRARYKPCRATAVGCCILCGNIQTVFYFWRDLVSFSRHKSVNQGAPNPTLGKKTSWGCPILTVNDVKFEYDGRSQTPSFSNHPVGD
jgi:hypothetical protein